MTVLELTVSHPCVIFFILSAVFGLKWFGLCLAGARFDWSMAAEPQGSSSSSPILTLMRTVMERGRVGLGTATTHQVNCHLPGC